MLDKNYIIKLITKGKNLKDNKGVQKNCVMQDIVIYYSHLSGLEDFREYYFIDLYYGLNNKHHTLEEIGQIDDKKVSRERVRQIINQFNAKIKLQESLLKLNINNPFEKTYNIFFEILKIKENKNEPFVSELELFKNEYFQNAKNNIKGIISFLNDCGIRQISYRKKYYFYLETNNREQIINLIQKINKENRKIKTLQKMENKCKTVTYVPFDTRDNLTKISIKEKINLNNLYEKILKNFLNNKKYHEKNYNFSKTQSWKARQGKAQWTQIGIYIDKNIISEIKKELDFLELEYAKKVSLMSFIAESFMDYTKK